MDMLMPFSSYVWVNDDLGAIICHTLQLITCANLFPIKNNMNKAADLSLTPVCKQNRSEIRQNLD